MNEVAALFVRSDSIYKTMPSVDCYDIDRDARTYKGGLPVVAHPPCRAWGGLRAFAKPRPDEKDLARFAVNQIRKYGGVLEHPASSILWADMKMSETTEPDEFGGWTMYLDQFWFGHMARKRTKIYIVGLRPAKVPNLPLVLGDAPAVVGSRKKTRPQIKKADREHTPPAFAEFLVNIARLTQYE